MTCVARERIRGLLAAIVTFVLVLMLSSVRALVYAIELACWELEDMTGRSARWARWARWLKRVRSRIYRMIDRRMQRP